MRIQTLEKPWLTLFASGGVLALVTVALLCPIGMRDTKAIDNTTRSATSLVSVDATAMVAVSLDTSINMTATPKTTAGEFTYGNAKLGVTTNNPEGYSVYMQTSDGKTSLHSDDQNNSHVVSSITKNTVGSSFTGNTWGYSISSTAAGENTTYQPIPANSSTPIKKTTTLTSSGATDTYQLGFGAHIDQTLPAGTYTNEVVVSVVANPTTLSTLNDLVYMQDMTPEICAATAEHTTKELIDARDDGSGITKKYWVTKLKDGHCWMTQNLAYDFKQGTVLTSADSDVKSDWTVPTDALTIGETGSYSDFRMWKGNDAENGRTGHMSYGNYYYWNAATTGTGGSSSSSAHSSSSICPKGWRLPKGGSGSDNEFQALVNAGKLTATTIQQAPYYFQLAGHIYTYMIGPEAPAPGSLRSAGETGNLWSSTRSNGPSNLYIDQQPLKLDADNGAPGGNAFGYSVRCLAK